MKYKNQELLRDWQHNDEAMQELTQHSPSKTAKKATITAILTSTNSERLLGCKVKKVDSAKMVSSTTTPTPLMAALVEAMGDNVVSLPQLLSTYYPNVPQREDYIEALKLGLTNMVELEAITKSHHRPKRLTPVQKLFYVLSKDDFRRDDKRVFADVTRAIALAAFNRVSGQPLVKSAGRGLYITHDTIRNCMQRPAVATADQIANSLVLLRIAGYVRLAQPEEWTEAGKLLAVSHDAAGKAVVSHHIYVLGNFSAANWSLITQNFNLDLHTSIGRTMLIQFLGADTVHNYFPDLSGGVSQPTINFMLTRSGESASNFPVMTLKAATDTVQAIDGVAKSTAGKYVDQVLLVKPIQMAKMSAREARENGYNLDEWQAGSPAEKLLFSTSQDALLMCIERLKHANKKGVRVSQLLED
ncbi:hypothetical protein [Lacticaseibacillus daqingensis]|uniref:hypothetical protein n=1 Tax=Lacticaseibacillus daqingensis TaxID=2486014 RepID=UPI000F7B67A1|nr:hypothetical protein [Lacticaseibacillus daqingensis]